MSACPLSRRLLLALLLGLGAVLFHHDVQAGQLILNWNDNSTNEDGFRIERKIGTGGTYAQIAQTAASASSYTDVGLTDGTSYCYRVRAFNAAGDSAFTNEACGTPSTPTVTLAATTGTATEAGAGPRACSR